MQCIILAAGEGVRMRPLTLTTPKPLLPICGKPIIEHIFDSLPPVVDSLLLVVGYRQAALRRHLGSVHNGRRIEYVVQEKPTGTADALFRAREKLAVGPFLLLYADDLHDPEGLARLAMGNRLSLLAAEHEHPERFGVIVTKRDGTIERLVEKPSRPPSRLVTTGALALDERIFAYTPDRSENGEYYLTTMVAKLAREHLVHVEREGWWIPIGYPEDLALAEQFLTSLTRMSG